MHVTRRYPSSRTLDNQRPTPAAHDRVRRGSDLAIKIDTKWSEAEVQVRTHLCCVLVNFDLLTRIGRANETTAKSDIHRLTTKTTGGVLHEISRPHATTSGETRAIMVATAEPTVVRDLSQIFDQGVVTHLGTRHDSSTGTAQGVLAKGIQIRRHTGSGRGRG